MVRRGRGGRRGGGGVHGGGEEEAEGFGDVGVVCDLLRVSGGIERGKWIGER